ncbi:MAG: hypothetical protein OER56_11330 [Hyphomicrobiales bacterium]|nr:hypothetical protein [Hyphomicrobiales bacterium]
MPDLPYIPTSAVEVVNFAMTRIGAHPVQSLDTPGPAGIAPAKTYSAVVLNVMSKYPWHFTKATVALERRTEAPVRGWQYRYKLPTDRIALPRAYYDSKGSAFAEHEGRPLTRFQLEGSEVLTDASEVWVTYQRVAPTPHWPGYFVELIILALAAELALVIREDRILRKELRIDAFGLPAQGGEGGLMGEAMSLDAQAVPAPRIDGGRNPVHDAGYLPGDIRNDWNY